MNAQFVSQNPVVPKNPVVPIIGRLLEEHDRLPMLVAGIAGVAGYNGHFHFREKYGDQIIGQRPVRNWPLKGDGVIGFDIDEAKSFRELLQKHGIKTIFNCGGSCALKACELDPVMAHRLNVARVQTILDAIKGTDIRLIHMSIDLVFSGTGQGDHLETDATDPVTVYGKTMVQAEDLILDQRPEACILRISLPMGISFNGHAGAIDWIQSRFAKNKPATLYYDEIRTPTYVECLNEVVEEVIVSEMSGIYHAGGPTKLSLYQIAQIVNRVGGYDPQLLMGCPRIEAGPVPPRAGDVTMDSTRLKLALGRDPFLPWPLQTISMPADRNWHHERQQKLELEFNLGSSEAISNTLYRRPNV
jgi:dTDP-4-dehydrorhamnose reductase